MKSVKKLTTLALFSTIALTIFLLESLIPPLVPIPGIKLGLANIVTLILLANGTWRDALVVLMARILLGSIFAGQMMSFFYSLAGGLACLLVMAILHHFLGKKLLWFTSIIGALAHNTGQIIVAALVLGSGYVFFYYPYLIVSGIITGLFTGLAALYLQPRLPKI
ncbi:MAG TPA: Gx transporter family protein [Candidatus Scybalocola faecavium]|nr:Gx transporter family protein [Candidatus Scybalocola faecavium]